MSNVAKVPKIRRKNEGTYLTEYEINLTSFTKPSCLSVVPHPHTSPDNFLANPSKFRRNSASAANINTETHSPPRFQRLVLKKHGSKFSSEDIGPPWSAARAIKPGW